MPDADQTLVGSVRPKRTLSLENQRKLLHAFKCALTFAATGFYVIYWLRITDNNLSSISLEWLTTIVAAFNVVSYSLPHIVVGAFEFIAAVIVSSLASYLSFYILGHGAHSLYYGAFLLFAFVFFVAASDRKKKHIFYIKFGIIFFAVTGILVPLANIHAFGLVTLWVAVYSVLFGIGASIFVTAVIFPLYPSQFIIPQTIDTIEECRNMYSACALFIKVAADLYL